MRGISRISKRDSRTPRLIEGTQAPILYTGLGVWKVLSFQEMMEED